jgi:CheY-like chemotaxis protein
MLTSPVRPTVRLSDYQIQSLMTALEKEPEFQAAVEQRLGERMPYREKSVAVEFASCADGPTICPVRNISQGGIGVLVEGFVQPGERCRVRLVSDRREVHAVTGRVVRCRYLGGGLRVHEVGVQFDSIIDVTLFRPSRDTARVLLLDASAAERRLFVELLERLRAEVSFGGSLDQTIAAAASNEFDLTTIGRSAHTAEACARVRALRARGHVRPVIVMHAPDGESAIRGRCARCEAIPLNSESLLRVVREVHVEPLKSTLAEEPAAAPLVRAFIHDFENRVDELEHLYARDDAAALTAAALRMAMDAREAGFAAIRSTAEALAKAAVAGTRQPDVLDRMMQFVRHARAMRALNG